MIIYSNPNGYCEHLDKNDIVVTALLDSILKGTVTINEVLEKTNK